MAVASPFLSLVSLVFHAGSLLLLFFILLAGAFDSAPLNVFYFFEADTSKISGAPSTSRWTPYNVCSVRNGNNFNCTKNKAAFPFDPVRNFNTRQGVPSKIADHHNKYFYMTRFAYAFYLISLFFDVVSFFFSFAGVCSRLGSSLSSFCALVAWIFVAAASALITACYVMAKSAFKDAGLDAKLGVKLFAFTWTVVFLLLASSFLSCCSCSVKRKQYANEDAYYSSSIGQGFGAGSLRRNKSEKTFGSGTPAQKRGFFHVKRKNDNFDSESQHPVIGATNSNNNDATSFERSPL